MRHILPRGPISTNHKEKQEDTPGPEKIGETRDTPGPEKIRRNKRYPRPGEKDEMLDVVSTHGTRRSFPAEKPFFFKRILVKRVICRIEEGTIVFILKTQSHPYRLATYHLS